MEGGTKRKAAGGSTPDGAKKSRAGGKNETEQSVAPARVWVLTTEVGFPPDGFHSYSKPEFKIRGIFQDTPANVKHAKAVAMSLVGEGCGLDFNEVEEGGDLEVDEKDDLIQYDWTPPDDEHTCVTLTRHPLNTVIGER